VRALPGEALSSVRSIDLLKGISDSIPEDVTVVSSAWCSARTAS